jgi:NADH:ubiquinone oxidoreductase subunit 6 (subunit J)
MLDFESVIFVIVYCAAIVGALGCVFSSRVAHSLLWLMFTFFAVAAAFLMASAEMLAAIQILVYLGSVMLVVQFGVMLTRRRIQDVESLPTLNAISAVSSVGIFAFILVLLRGMMEHSIWDSDSSTAPTTLGFADAIFNDWTMATVILGSLLAMAMIGASYLVRDERLINLLWDMGVEE